jgi:hypothetical protein
MTDLPAVTELDATTVAGLIAIIIPALTALVTKWNVDSRIRTTVAILLSAVAGAVGTLVAGDGNFDWQTFGLSTLIAFVTEIALYVGVYKPQGIAAAIAGATPGFGIGTSQPEEAPVTEDGAYVVTDVPASSEDVPGEDQDDDTEPQPDVPDPDLPPEDSPEAMVTAAPTEEGQL